VIEVVQIPTPASHDEHILEFSTLHAVFRRERSFLVQDFRSESFDVVNCCGAVHLFPDIPRALAEIQRVLAPGGRFTAAVFRRGPSEREVRRAEQRERMMGVHAFSREELEGSLADAGFVAARFPHEHGIWMLAAAEKPAA
jgi:SAM-dependent methyltransferase